MPITKKPHCCSMQNVVLVTWHGMGAYFVMSFLVLK